ncbi:hypothetical protein D9M70_553750 [compost metagenome]
MVVEDLGNPLVRHFQIQIGYLADVFLGELAVLLAQVLAQLLVKVGGVYQLHFAAPLLILLVGQQPDIGSDASVVEQVVGQLDNGFEVVFLDEVAADVAFAPTCVPGEQGRTVVNGGDT